MKFVPEDEIPGELESGKRLRLDPLVPELKFPPKPGGYFSAIKETIHKVPKASFPDWEGLDKLKTAYNSVHMSSIRDNRTSLIHPDGMYGTIIHRSI